MAVAQKPVAGPAALQRRGRFRPGDAILYVVTLAAALTGLVLLILIAREVLADAWPAMDRFGLEFLTTQAWDTRAGQEAFGARSFIFGTAVTSFGALLLATPISIAIALFLTELAPGWIRSVVGPLVELLAAVPTVVLGLWGILVLGPFIVDTLGPTSARDAGLPADLQHRADCRLERVRRDPDPDDHDDPDHLQHLPRALPRRSRASSRTARWHWARRAGRWCAESCSRTPGPESQPR